MLKPFIFDHVTIGRGLPSLGQRSLVSAPSVTLYDFEGRLIKGASTMISKAHFLKTSRK